MPTQAYEILVTQNGKQSKNTAVANASKYLSYADQSDTVGYTGDVFDVNIYGGNGTQDYGIGLCVAVKIENDVAERRFEQELENLAKVETFEKVHYQVIE